MVPLIVLILGVSALAYAQNITYEQLLQSASKNSFRLKLGLTDTKIEESRLDTLYSGYYPTLSAGYNVEYNKKLDGGVGGSASIGDTVIYDLATLIRT
jgi:outer membrane protein TolC